MRHSRFWGKTNNGKYVGDETELLGDRNYGVFAFLAGVRNYGAIVPISKPRGLPKDVSSWVEEEADRWASDGHSRSWLSIDELLNFDYEQMTEDRRCTRMKNGVLNGGCTCDPGEGEKMTYREYLGESFFEDLAELKKEGVDRIVFWFDN